MDQDNHIKLEIFPHLILVVQVDHNVPGGCPVAMEAMYDFSFVRSQKLDGGILYFCMYTC